MDQRAPLVSIGMPTYNGARYLAQSLDSLLGQDYPNFELVISDNCSTDETGAIARSYAKRSDRVLYVRHETHVGVSASFNRALGLARGTYFMWAADHDLWEPTLISRCFAALEADPAAVLAYPQSLLIDGNGAVIEEMDDQIDLDQPSALDRYKRLIWRLAICNMIYGVARREALVATGGFPDVFSPDHLVLARLALRGPILRVGGHLYLRRQNRPPETADEDRKRRLDALYPSKAGDRASMPASHLYRDLRDLHIRAIRESSLSVAEKLDGTAATLACFRARFGVDSAIVGLLLAGARVTRQRARLDRRFGNGA
ncbi:MAG TPA: glycosyltransferase [Candidatus Limnocylindrales bacterium]